MYFKLNNKVLPKAVSKLTHLELLKSMFTTRAVVRVMMVVVAPVAVMCWIACVLSLPQGPVVSMCFL